MFCEAPLRKFVLLSLCSFGAYQLRWFYDNWWAVRMRTGRRIHPMWRSLLFPIFCYPMFRQITAAARNAGLQTRLSPAAASVFYVIPVFFSRLHGDLWPLAFLALVPAASVHALAIRVNQSVTPDADTGEGYTHFQRLLLILGGLLLALTVLSTWIS